MHADLSQAITQRLALYYKVDDALPALSALIRPKNIEELTDMNDIIGPRQLSNSFHDIYKTLSPDSSTSEGFSKHVETLGDVQEQITLITMLKEKMEKEAPNGGPISMTIAMKDMIDSMWRNTDIIHMTLNSRRTTEDVTDEMNVTTLSYVCRNWLSGLKTRDFVEGVFQSFLIGDGTLDKARDTMNLNLDNRMNYTEVINSTPASFSRTFGFVEMIETLSPSNQKKTKRKINKAGFDYVEVLIRHLTALDTLQQVPLVAAHFAPKELTTNSRQSTSKELNQVLLEMESIEDLLALRIFNALNAWVALTQRTIIPYQRPEALEYVKSLFSNFSSTYDVEGIMNDFLALPIGKMANEFVNKNEDVVSVTATGSQMTTIVCPYEGVAPEDGLDFFAGTVRHIVLSLYPLMKNKDLWTLYKKGALVAGASAPTFKRVTRSLDNLPVVFSSFGSFAGNKINNFDDVNWTINFDWGVNKFNSSAQTDIIWNSADTDELIQRYSHGIIDYQEYVKKVKLKLTKFQATGVSGYTFSQHNVPLLAVRRRSLKMATPFLGVDLGLIKFGATSLLPVPPMNYSAVTNTAKTSFIEKEIIGDYETKIDNLPLLFNHTAPRINEPISIHDSIIPQILRISKENFNRSEAVGTTLLNRFISKASGAKGVLNCETISEDPFFASMVSHFFISPSPWVSHDMYELHLRPFIRVDEGQEDIGAVLAKKLSVHTFVSGQGVLDKSLVGSRILSSCTALDRTDTLPKSSHMGYINPEHGIIED